MSPSGCVASDVALTTDRGVALPITWTPSMLEPGPATPITIRAAYVPDAPLTVVVCGAQFTLTPRRRRMMFDDINTWLQTASTGAQTTLGWLAVIMLILFALGVIYYVAARALIGAVARLVRAAAGRLGQSHGRHLGRGHRRVWRAVRHDHRRHRRQRVYRPALMTAGRERGQSGHAPGPGISLRQACTATHARHGEVSMSYVRQAFGNAGEDRVSGLIAKKHITGAMSGAIGGLGLGMLVWGLSVTTGVLGLVGGVGGLIIMIDVGGLRLLDRLQLWAGYLLRRLAGATGVPPSSRFGRWPPPPRSPTTATLSPGPTRRGRTERVAAPQNGRAAAPASLPRTNGANGARPPSNGAIRGALRPPKDSAMPAEPVVLQLTAFNQELRADRDTLELAWLPMVRTWNHAVRFQTWTVPITLTSRATASPSANSASGTNNRRSRRSPRPWPPGPTRRRTSSRSSHAPCPRRKPRCSIRRCATATEASRDDMDCGLARDWRSLLGAAVVGRVSA